MVEGDLLISTDVDNLIRILKVNKRMELRDLARAAGMSERSAEKWCRVLEEQDLVKIEYKLTRTYLSWTGSVPEAAHYYLSSESADVYEPDEPQVLGSGNIEVIEPIHTPLTPTRAPEIKFELSKKKEDEKEEKKKSTKKDEKKDEKEEKKKSTKKDEKSELKFEIKEARSIYETKPESINLISNYGTSEAGHFDVPTASSLQAQAEKDKDKPKSEAMQISEELKAKIAEINAKASEIENLKRSKDKLLRETYIPIERRFESEVEVLRDILLNKERKILELQQRAISIPDMISDVDKQVLKMKDVEREARKTFEETNELVKQDAAHFKQLNSKLKNYMDDALTRIQTESSKLSEMEKVLVKMRENEQQLKERLEEAKMRIYEETSKIKMMEVDLEKMRELEADVHEKIEFANEAVSEEREKTAHMEQELEKFSKVDNWLSSHQQAYEDALNKFSSYINESEEEFSNVRETIETGFVRKYLNDLRELGESHEYEIGQVERSEDELNRRIENSKNQLSELIAESKQISERISGVLKTKETIPEGKSRLSKLGDKKVEMAEKITSVQEERADLLNELRSIFRKRK
ncbi:MAG: hypothetical protein ABIH99_01190 [Candidatus Micrarchaeota archaeon]